MYSAIDLPREELKITFRLCDSKLLYVHPAFGHEIRESLNVSFKTKFIQTDKMSLHRSRSCLRLLSFQLPPLRQASYLYA